MLQATWAGIPGPDRITTQAVASHPWLDSIDDGAFVAPTRISKSTATLPYVDRLYSISE